MGQVRRQQAGAHAVGDHGPQHLDRACLGDDAGRRADDLEQRQEIAPAVGQVDQHHRIARQIAQRHGPRPRQRMVRPDQRMGRHRPQRAEVEIGRQIRVIDQRQVDPAAAQAADQFGQIAFGQGDARSRIAGGKAAHQPRGIAWAERRIDAEDQLARRAGSGRQGGAGMGHQRCKGGQLLPAEGGRAHPLSGKAQEQGMAEMRLDLRNGLRHRGLRDMAGPRRGGGRAGLGHRHHIGDLAQADGNRLH